MREKAKRAVIALITVSCVPLVSADLVQLTYGAYVSEEILIQDQVVTSPVSAEGFVAYLSSGEVAQGLTLDDYNYQLLNLAQATLSSSEQATWISICMDTLEYAGQLPEMELGDGGWVDPWDFAEPQGGTLYKEDILRLDAIEALFGQCTPATDPGLVDYISDDSQEIYFRHVVWRRLVDDWGLTALPEPTL